MILFLIFLNTKIIDFSLKTVEPLIFVFFLEAQWKHVFRSIN